MFLALLKTHLKIEQHGFVDKLINILLWTICCLFVYGYALQLLGIDESFGFFMLGGIAGFISFFETFANAVATIADFEGDRITDYYLTLPTTPSVIFASTICARAIVGSIRSLCIIPVGLIMLWGKYTLVHTSWTKVLIMIFLANIFFGVLGFTLAAYAKTMTHMRNIWMRYMNPLWILGGFQFSWYALYQFNPNLGIIILANPIIYISEGVRAGLQGQEMFISWWICCSVIIFFCIIAWIYMIHSLKKLLDFI